jgi:riboflavin kinase/FMN adenylyltransferase
MPPRCVITLGNFDGVHVGHRRILATARELAHRRGVPLKVFTFDPHPRALLGRGDTPPRLMSLQRRIDTLKQLGADEVRVLATTKELLNQSAQDFLLDLVQREHPIAFIEGENFRFGHDRRGDVDLMRRIGAERGQIQGEDAGFDALAVSRVAVALHDLWQAPVSSSLIRWLLEQGRVADAARCLGECFSVTGTVIHGQQRGRTLGVPTANLDVAALNGLALPADGVYAGVAKLGNASNSQNPGGTAGVEIPAAVSIGVKPTFGPHQKLVEAHLVHWEGDLYGRTITLCLARFLRDQQPFPSAADLQRQLQRDIARTQTWHDLGLLQPRPRAADDAGPVNRSVSTTMGRL